MAAICQALAQGSLQVSSSDRDFSMKAEVPEFIELGVSGEAETHPEPG